MIPKVIHYCWFGGNPLPELAVKCIESWKKFFPDYEIKCWDESNFDVNMIPYTQQAYEAKKFAFVSDYARFWILYKFGGLYFDTDVEVIKNMDDIVESGPFMGCENSFISGAKPFSLGVNPGLGLGVYPTHPFYKEILDFYKTLSFKNKDGSLNKTTVVSYTTSMLCKKGLSMSTEIQDICGIKIYPVDYFCPQDYRTGKLIITGNTKSIHHYSASWHGPKEKMYILVKKLFGERLAKFCSKKWKQYCHSH